MKKTIAEMYREEGVARGSITTTRKYLQEVLEERFGPIPDDLVQIIESCESEPQLDQWFRAARSARTLKGVGIQASS